MRKLLRLKFNHFYSTHDIHSWWRIENFKPGLCSKLCITWRIHNNFTIHTWTLQTSRMVYSSRRAIIYPLCAPFAPRSSCIPIPALSGASGCSCFAFLAESEESDWEVVVSVPPLDRALQMTINIQTQSWTMVRSSRGYLTLVPCQLDHSEHLIYLSSLLHVVYPFLLLILRLERWKIGCSACEVGLRFESGWLHGAWRLGIPRR